MKRSIAFGKCMDMVILLLSARIRRLRIGWSSACRMARTHNNFAGQTDLPEGKSNPGIELRQINPTGKSLLIFRNRVKPRNQKYSCFRLTQIRCISLIVLPTEARQVNANAPHSQSSSPGLTGRPSIPQASVIEPRGRGVLDTPHARSMTAVGTRKEVTKSCKHQTRTRLRHA